MKFPRQSRSEAVQIVVKTTIDHAIETAHDGREEKASCEQCSVSTKGGFAGERNTSKEARQGL